MYNIEGSLWLLKYFGDLRGKRILEYGNQHIWQHAKKTLSTEHDVARDMFLERGVAEYKSIDINGQDGALVINLAARIPYEFDGLFNRFDFVTNVGTTEHFGKQDERQWWGFVNAVLFAKVGGLVLHQLPPAGQWLDHCDVWYKDGLGEVLAYHLACELVEESRLNLPTLNPAVDYLCIALRKIADVPVPAELHFSLPPDDFIRSLSK